MNDARVVIFVWEDDSLWTSDTQLCGQRRFEEFVICSLHEGIIDHCHPLENCILEIDPIVWYLMGDSINNDCIGTWLIHPRAAQSDEFGDDALAATVNFFNEGGRKGPFPPDKQANLQRPHVKFLPPFLFYSL